MDNCRGLSFPFCTKYRPKPEQEPEPEPALEWNPWDPADPMNLGMGGSQGYGLGL